MFAATHLGDGVFGPATGKQLCYRVIADCAARENAIDNEWLVRDQGAIVRQLGIDPKRHAADRVEAEGGPDACVTPLAPGTDVEPRYRGRGNDGPHGARYAELVTRVMAADLAAVPAIYDRAVQIETPGGVTGHGRDAVDRLWLGSLPQAHRHYTALIDNMTPCAPSSTRHAPEPPNQPGHALRLPRVGPPVPAPCPPTPQTAPTIP